MDIVVDEELSRGETMLVQRSRRGDRKAYAQLVDCYWDSLFASIHFLVADERRADVATQATFMRLYSALPALTTGGNFRDWLLRTGYEVVFRESSRATQNRLVEMKPDDSSLSAFDTKGRDRLISFFGGRRSIGNRQTVPAEARNRPAPTWRRRIAQAASVTAMLLILGSAGAWLGNWASEQVTVPEETVMEAANRPAATEG